MAKIYTAADQLVGGTPLLELVHIEKQEGLKAILNGNTVKRSLTDLPRGKEKRDVRMYGPDGQFCALYSYDPVRDELKNVKMFPAGSR